MCPTVQLESSFSKKKTISHNKVTSRQIETFVAALFFLWPAGQNLIFVLQNSTPGGVGEPLPKTFSQIRGSRDQNFYQLLLQDVHLRKVY